MGQQEEGRGGSGPRGGRQEEDEEEQACCSQVQAEKTGPDRRPAGGGGQVGDEEQESGGGGGQPQGGEGGAAVCPGGTQTVLQPAKPQRPASLSLAPVTVKNIEGVPIDTPSNGILSFNTLLEGRTGLTPTNILTPTSLWAT